MPTEPSSGLDTGEAYFVIVDGPESDSHWRTRCENDERKKYNFGKAEDYLLCVPFTQEWSPLELTLIDNECARCCIVKSETLLLVLQ